MKQVVFLFLVLNYAVVAQTGSVAILIRTVFNNENLVLDKKSYMNQNGDSLTVEAFRFYLSNFKVYSGGKVHSVKNSYYLIDADKPSEAIVLKDLPQEKTDSISFLIGVDSLMNTSGALDGALDPGLGMFWAWNTGYINAKLEGKSKSCKTLHQAYEFHIGGYLSPYNAIRKVTLRDPVTNGVVKLKADAARWFYGPTKIDLKNFNSVVTPCTNAQLIADNYQFMFSLEK